MMTFFVSNREFVRRPRQLLLYVFCLVLCFGVFLSLDSLQMSIETNLAEQQQSLVGGDIVITSNQPFSVELETAVSAEIDPQDQVEMYDFSSMIRSESSAVLASVKIVSDAYPLYGDLLLDSQQPLAQMLTTGTVIVDPALLVSLQVKVGDTVFLGDGRFTIIDTIVSLPDESLSLSGFGGSTVLVSVEDRDSLNLLGDKSRVTYKKLLRVSDTTKQKNLLESWQPLAQKPVEIESIDTIETSLARFSGRFLLFMKLIIFSLLMLNALAMMNIIVSFLRSQEFIIATRKALGEPERKILVSYHGTFLAWSLVALWISALGAWFILWFNGDFLASFFPDNFQLELSGMSLAKTFLLGLATTFLLAQAALSPVMKMRPAALFQYAYPSVNRLVGWQSWVWLSILYGVFIYLEFESFWFTLGFYAGVVGLFALFFGLTKFLLWFLHTQVSRVGFLAKLLIRSLNRPGASTSLFVSILTVSLTFICTILLVETTLQKEFIAASAENAPSVFLLDVRSDQVKDLQTFFDQAVQLYPVIRGRIAQVNGVDITTLSEQNGGFRDNVTRVFNLTYYEELLTTENLVASAQPNSLFGTDTANDLAAVSILDSLAETLDLALGDPIDFSIQGVTIAAQVTSIRSRNNKTSPTPFFYFVFEPAVLSAVPQTLFATADIETADFNTTQKKLLDQFPQISVINTTAIAEQVGTIVGQLSILIRFFTLLSLIVGVVVLVSSLVATTKNRQEEAAFYRLQGMTQARVWRLVLIEMAFLAFLVVAVSLWLSFLVAWVVMDQLFAVSVAVSFQLILGYVVSIFVVIMLVAVFVLRRPLQLDPMEFIRQYT